MRFLAMATNSPTQHDLSIRVTGKAGKERNVGIGHKTAQAIECYLRRRQLQNPYLWLTTGNRGLFLPSFGSANHHISGADLKDRRQCSKTADFFAGAHLSRHNQESQSFSSFKNLPVTMDIYAHVLPGMEEEAALAVERILEHPASV